MGGEKLAIAPTSPRAPRFLQSILQTTCVDITLILAVGLKTAVGCTGLCKEAQIRRFCAYTAESEIILQQPYVEGSRILESCCNSARGLNQGLLQQNHEGTGGVVLGLFYSRIQRIKCFGSTGVMVEVPFGTMGVKREEHCGCGSSNRNDFRRGRGRGRGSEKGTGGVVLGLFYSRIQRIKCFGSTGVMVKVPFGTMGVKREEHCGCGSSNRNDFGRGRGRGRGSGKGQDGERFQ
ncbi:hypothetical protein R6Q59_032344 [Mikania micrantha]